MSLQPDALVLLDAVSRTLGREVAPTLSGSDRYQVLLAANAVAMARRELAADERILAAETRAMAELLGDEIDGGGDIVKRHALLTTHLAEAVRARRFDEPERQGALLDCLVAMTLRVLGETNPGVAAKRGGSSGD